MVLLLLVHCPVPSQLLMVSVNSLPMYPYNVKALGKVLGNDERNNYFQF